MKHLPQKNPVDRPDGLICMMDHPPPPKRKFKIIPRITLEKKFWISAWKPTQLFQEPCGPCNKYISEVKPDAMEGN